MTTQSDPRASAVRTVAVPGGDLAYEVLAGETRPVLAVHGISSHRRLWGWLRAAAPELTLLAPDLRGRGDSVAVPGPWGVARHADDLALLLDAEGLDRVPVVGMSMGGFVAVALADSFRRSWARSWRSRPATDGDWRRLAAATATGGDRAPGTGPGRTAYACGGDGESWGGAGRWT